MWINVSCNIIVIIRQIPLAHVIATDYLHPVGLHLIALLFLKKSNHASSWWCFKTYQRPTGDHLNGFCVFVYNWKFSCASQHQQIQRGTTDAFHFICTSGISRYSIPQLEPCPVCGTHDIYYHHPCQWDVYRARGNHSIHCKKMVKSVNCVLSIFKGSFSTCCWYLPWLGTSRQKQCLYGTKWWSNSHLVLIQPSGEAPLQPGLSHLTRGTEWHIFKSRIREA